MEPESSTRVGRHDVVLTGRTLAETGFDEDEMVTRNSRNNLLAITIAFGFGLLLPLTGSISTPLVAQAPAPTPAARQLGTVKSVSGDTVTLTTDAGQSVTVTVPAEAKVVELAVGSTDLKTAKPSQLTDIAVGDRVLATGKAGDTPAELTARMVVVMKSADIALKQEADQADWRARGTGGIVSAVDPATGTITLTSGTKKVVVNTSSKTNFRRFAGDSVKYSDAKPGTLAQIHVKDQLQARGTKSEDGLSVQAEEVVSGAFENLSGQIVSVDPTAGVITLKDLATKKMMTVDVTAKADIRKMPLQMATAFAARTNGGSAAQGGGGRRGGGGQDASGGAGGQGSDAGGMRRSAGADLSQMIGRMPTITAADLHKGDAVMIVASEATPGASTVTALTVLTGVDPILTANPNGGMDLSMSVGGGATE
jgi:co-chaperonin GroES (HSP10)